MSKPVTNEEVEDVLSSIRRLVSEDKRPLAGARAAGLGPAAGADEAGPTDVAGAEAEAHSTTRLVLTPALRVAGSQPEAEPSNDESPLDLGAVARETWHDTEGVTADSETDELDASEQPSDAVPMMLFPLRNNKASEPSDASLQSSPEADVITDDDELLEGGDYSDEGYWDVEEGSEADRPDQPKTDDAADWDMDDYAAAEEAYAEAEDGDIEDGREEDEALSHAFDAGDRAQYDDTNADEGATVDEDVKVDERLNDAEADALKASDEPLFERHGDRKPTVVRSNIPLTDKIAAMEAAVSEIASEWEPDGDELEALAATASPAMAWEDDVQLDAKGAPIPSEAPTSAGTEATSDATGGTAGAAAAFGNGEDQVMDEAALRELVSEMVRAELQGALGERITRNVRKLVRREIHRALTAQEME